MVVLLIEAGGAEQPLSDIPKQSLFNTDMDWKFKSTPQAKSCLGLIGTQVLLPRGKVMGGTSTINGMVYIRGNHRDYDLWAEDGNYGWSWKEMLPYFLRAEDMQ